MDRDATRDALEKYCAERVGPDIAASFMKLARPGFALTPAEGTATGHCRHGGDAMLVPGTPWPAYRNHPMSLIAVLDTDALGPWLDGVVPPGTGLLNFFHLDLYSEQADVDDILHDIRVGSPLLGAVIAAPTARAVETWAPEGAGVFGVTEWEATPGWSFPDDWDPAYRLDELDPYEMITLFADRLADLREQPGVVSGGDLAFGRPDFPTGGTMSMDYGVDPKSLHHLLQLGGDDSYAIGGEGGIMHWSIPSAALAEGAFGEAFPTPDHF